MILGLAIASLVLAALPALLFLRNLSLYKPAPTPPSEGVLGPVSVLIPARNEERSIGDSVRSVLANQNVELELIVLDDRSEDATEKIVAEIAATDSRVRLISGEPLPEGWCGKQFACAQLAKAAKYPFLLFLDADVRLEQDSLRRGLAFLRESQAKLISGFPRQETGTFLEWTILPLIHFILLGFLPIGRMRQSRSPGLAAGCGQLFLAEREAYQAIGGHEAVRQSLHDGITLPRAFRSHGFMTDLFDATDVAICRMYRSAGEVWQGLAKNAHEGLGAPKMIVFTTLLLFIGQVLPLILVFFGAYLSITEGILVGAALGFAYLPRVCGIFRFRQSLAGALLHPVGVLLLLLIQWYAFFRRIIGGGSSWKGRSYKPA